MKPDPERLAQV